MNRVQKSKWPINPEDLLCEIDKIYHDFIRYPCTQDLNMFNSRKFLTLIEYLIRANHIYNQRDIIIKSNEIILSIKKKLMECNLFIKSCSLTPILKELFNKDFSDFEEWVNLLIEHQNNVFREESSDLFDTRDFIQAEIEILSILQINIQPELERLKIADDKLKIVAKEQKWEMDKEIDRKVYPKKIYWWWYLNHQR